VARARAARAPVLGDLNAFGDSIAEPAVAPVVVRGIIAGYIVEWTRLAITPSADQISKLFGGNSTHVRLVNADGSLWTDLTRRIPASPVDLNAGGLLSYVSPVSGPVFAVVAPIAGLHIVVVMESAQSDVLARARPFTGKLSLAGVLLLLLGVVGTLAITASIANPVSRLTRAADERYRLLVQESPNGISLTTVDGQFLSVNPAFIELLGYQSADELMAVDVADTYLRGGSAAILAQFEKDPHIHRAEVELRRKDGTAVVASFTGRRVSRAGQTEPYIEAVFEDMTKQRMVEQQFYQAQKMEAVGQLAGGVAHDFNNLLTVILAVCGLALTEGVHSYASTIGEIRQAADRAAMLSRQLLTFSRRELIDPMTLDLNDIVLGLESMIRRLTSESLEMAILTSTASAPILADWGQVEQVIVNLVVNARDAMPDGGVLQITTSTVDVAEGRGEAGRVLKAGAYALLTVSDSGTGMTEEVKARLFEPFFTTKGIGRGTGLGLSTCHAIVRQCKGHIVVESALGRGTTMRVYFPRSTLPLSRSEPVESSGPPRGGTERILLVEDEAQLRRVAATILSNAGYTVFQAGDGEDALRVFAAHPEGIDLLLTDVGLPKLGGRLLADRIASERPLTKILFASGYSDDAVLQQRLNSRAGSLLVKPYDGRTLVRKVREALDAEARVVVGKGGRADRA
jgi:two-component system cell cycle sensor histidine kinase/response regulator CckA